MLEEDTPAAKQLVLSESQGKELEAWKRNPPKPYVRRKVLALLLVARGKAAYQTAQDRRVHANRMTVSVWIEKFQTQGLAGLNQAKDKVENLVFPLAQSVKRKLK